MCFLGFSQCPPPGEIVLSSQEEVDQFVADYSGTCDGISGNLILLSKLTGVNTDNPAASEITDISGLDFLKSINGSLTITINASEIIGFNLLTSVKGDIEITSSSSVQNINGFNNLNFVNRIVIANNTKLKIIEGFHKIKSLESSIEIGNNDSLEEIQAFNNILSIKGELNISNNKVLQKVSSFSRLVEIFSDLNLTSNPKLFSIEGFKELRVIGNDLNIEFIKEIYGFDNLRFVNRYLDFRNGIQKIPSFNNLEKVGAGFRIQNTRIQSINGFNSLLKTGDDFFLEDWFIISGNPILNEVRGFGRLIFVEGMLEVKNNPQLNDCSWLCNILNNGKITGNLIIQNNLNDCSNASKIIEICDPDFDNDGIANVVDLDDDNDGILDINEGNGLIDTDGDGFPDSLDLDADNDNCFDVIEAGFKDENGDGVLGNLPTNVDFNGKVILVSSGYTTPLDVNSNGIFDFQEESTLNPGKNGIIEICLNSPPIDLIDGLNGNPDSGGFWTPALQSGTGVFNPFVDKAGIYTYTHTNKTLNCGERTAQVLVEIPSTLNAGLDTEVTFCEENRLINLFDLLNGNPSQGGSWSPELASKTNIFDPTIDKAGVYTYTINDEFCGRISSKITIKNNSKPNAGIGTKIEICEFSPNINLLDFLSGNPDKNGIWSPNLPNGIFNPSINLSGIYTYTVDNGSCGIDTATIEVVVLKDNPLTNVTVNINDFSASNNQIQVFVFSKRKYEYSLDGIQYQLNNFFNNVSGGEQTVYVRGVDGCEFYSEKVFVKTYPTFFTPNNDGENDFWRLKDFPFENYKILIYNRFGNIIKEISSSSGFWDGNFNGNPAPSSNYWFKVVTDSGQIFTGNFSLLRK
ncbi:T9SS type B sorting domain-containing protein [Polaribacter sp.]|uniref:T9SS type B sorting domain-containing protein n=2 Tax=Polaribacter sp. TaxID=1920175 RepID=UPI0040477C6C